MIGGFVTAVGGILMIIFTWFAPLLVGIVAGILAIVWGALSAISYWL